MNKKQIPGLLLVLIGLFFLCSSLYKMYRVWDVTTDIEEIVGPIPDEPFGETVDKMVEHSVGYNQKREMTFLIGGSIILICGGFLIYYYRKRS